MILSTPFALLSCGKQKVEKNEISLGGRMNFFLLDFLGCLS
jgi:hypothetical protein